MIALHTIVATVGVKQGWSVWVLARRWKDLLARFVLQSCLDTSYVYIPRYDGYILIDMYMLYAQTL